MKKGATRVANQVLSRRTQKKAAGGSIFGPKGTDTVPAMLTPGEFVINRKSAEKFGYGNLKKINQYAKGGRVQYLQGGGRLTIREALAKYEGDIPKGFSTHKAEYDKLGK